MLALHALQNRFGEKKLHSKSMPDCHGPGKITTRKFKGFHYSATNDFLVHHHDLDLEL